MKIKKAVLLFEAVFTVLIVSIISLFLFRGYSIFLKAAKKNMGYLKAMELCEEKIWDFQAIERSEGELSLNMEKQGDFKSLPFGWSLEIEDTDYEGLKKTTVEVKRKDRPAAAFSGIFFLKFKEG